MSLRHAARFASIAIVAAALLVAPIADRTPVAHAATPTAFTTVPTTAAVGSPYTFSGTVTDDVAVGAVEVSTDDGVTWRPATWQAGRTAWSHTYTPGGSGPAHLKVRALDAARDTVGQATADTTVAARVCPCGLWSDEVPATVDASDNAALELGLKWRSTTDGYVRGVRFYKGAANTGTHTGSLWNAAGTRLATGTFHDETGTGWQTLVFPQPVAVAGNTTYVVSYFSPTGHFSVDTGYFGTTSRYLEPLTGLQTGVDGANGVFHGGGGFPDTGGADANYWVDVVWAPEPGADTRAPDLLTTSPVAGAGSVAPSPTIGAAYDETIAPGSAEFALTGPSGAVAGQTSLSGNGKTVEFHPDAALPAGTAFTASSKVRDAAGNQTAAYTWTFTTGRPRPAECPCTLWDDFTAPAAASAGDARPVELGVKVRFAAKGQVLGVRFYKGEGNTGTHTGSLWSATGTRLATGTFTGETSTGWQTLTFADPVNVAPATSYVVTYYAPNGHYAVTQSQFAGRATTYGPITAPAEDPASPNGLFRYDGGFPTTGYLASNYWVDVVYRTGLNGDSTRPTLDTRTPGPNATDVALDPSVDLGFSEPIDPDSAVITLGDGGGGLLRGTTTFAADGKSLTWKPNGSLKPGTKYSVSVQASDLNGNSLAAPATWDLTTRSTATCPCSLFSTATVPTTPSANDGGNYELGVRFTVPRGGLVTAVRFYKGEGNTGTHTGSIWSPTGERLGTGTFTGETATGWQTLTFAQPVSVHRDLVYTASYTAPNGHYAVEHQYFTRRDPVTSGPLATGAGPFSGVFAPGGGFPTRSYEGNNYWVDVDFATFADTTPPVNVSHNPPDDGTGAGLSAPVVATYDEQVSLTDSTVQVKDSHGVVMRGTVTRADDDHSLVWTPAAPLVRTTPYTVSVRATDVHENTLPTPTTWTYTTGDAPCPCTLFSEASIPEILSYGYYGGTGAGINFVPKVNGFVTGIKFYKGPYNGRTHYGAISLSSTKTVAGGEFTNESATGWQTLTFATPAPVTAGTTYLAWYKMLDGQWTQTTNYFKAGGIDTPQLSAPANPNGLLGRFMSFPDYPNENTGNNHWVDVVFTTS
ncbi:DUF4082 domain-containing protein [Actinosynnema sp. NPDC020468]|uniref:DUF4082 domain-containing protein n=1 Tax=Actinosynnema sp. NPDC020468 TaxID=3154488 RepID=UPI0033FAA9E1